jgi:hypothetical protein
MNKSGLFAAALAFVVSAASGADLIETAPVVSVTPIIGRVTSTRPRCMAPARNCARVDTPEESVRGYRVVYRYHGLELTTTLPYDPGPTVRVGVSVMSGGAAGASRADIYATPAPSAPSGQFSFPPPPPPATGVR